MPEVKVAQRSPEWFEARRGRVTASLAAACLGLDPYISRQKAWRLIMGTEPEREENGFMRWGTEHEGDARTHYEAECGQFVTETGFWVHDDYPWLGASPDGLVGADGLFEAKCPQNLPERVPIAHRIQCGIELACTGRAWCDYLAWTPDGHYLKRVTRAGGGCLVHRLKLFYLAHITTGIDPGRKPRRKRKAG